MSVSEQFLLALLVVYVVPWMVWRLARLEAVAPLAIVQIVGGVVLGPGLAGVAFPEWHQALFNGQTIPALTGVAWWGVVLFVFLAGLELDLGAAWRDRRDTAITAGLALGVPFVLGALAALVLVRGSAGWGGDNANEWQVVLGLGMSCAVTALPILVLLLERLNILHTPLGQRALRYASLDDVAIWGVLALILMEWQRVGRQALFLALFAAASFAMRRIVPRLADADRLYVGVFWLIALSFAADWSGLHFMVGAFLAGAVLDLGWFGRARIDALRNAVLLTLMPVFFLSTGLRTSWSLGGMQVLGVAAMLLAAAVAGKLIGLGIAGRVLNWPRGEARVVGWLLQTKALIMIIFANILLDKGIISADTFTALLLMAVVSTVLTVPMVRGKLAALAGRTTVDVP